MRLYQLFADVLDYPGADLPRRMDECVSLLLLLQEDEEAVEKEIPRSTRMEEFRHDQ